MKHKNLLQLISLTIIILIVAGWARSVMAVTTHTVPEAQTSTVTPTLPPTSTPIPLTPTITLSPTLTVTMVFSTPEEAITHYFAGLTEADPAKILQACAVNEMSENFRFDLYTERLRAFMPVLALAPATHPLYIENNKAQLTAQTLNRVKLFTFSLLSAEEVESGQTIIIDAERTAKFMQDVDPSRLAGLELKQIAPPRPDLLKSDRYIENAAKRAAVFGAQESTERVALFSFEGDDYYLGFSLLRFGEHWKISEQVSPLGATNSLGTPENTTPTAFEALINEE